MNQIFFLFPYCFFFGIIVYYQCHSYDDLYTGKNQLCFFDYAGCYNGGLYGSKSSIVFSSHLLNQ